MNKRHLTEAEQQELLLRMKKNYTYDTKSGRLTSSRYGRAIRGAKINKGRYLGVGCIMNKKYVHVFLHHAVWAVCKGCWPKQQLDHINGNKYDNRIENLREVNGSENNMNMLHPWKPNAKTGLPRVLLDKRGFRTKSHGKRYYYHSPYEAFHHLTLIGRRFK